MKSIYRQILNYPQDLSGMVLATVAGTSGSTPQKAGSSALFNKSGLIYGTVGGGILEGKVQVLALEASQSGRSGYYYFRLDNKESDGEDALCGGKIEILVDAKLREHISVFEELSNSVESGVPGILITTVAGGSGGGSVISRYWATAGKKPVLPEGISETVLAEINTMLVSLKPDDFRKIVHSKPEDEASFFIFLEPVIPPLRLIIAGAGHIGKALAKIGQMLDFEVTVIDDRPEFANPVNLGAVDHIIGDIGETISDIDKADDTFIVIVTRGHRDDASALRACIGSDAGYIGMIGSRNKIALMRKEFIENGWATREQWDRIYAPIGLDIKSKTVEEIAISIAAQLVQIKNTNK